MRTFLGAGLMVAALAAFLPSTVSAQPIDKASNGQFTAIALVTDDARWYEKFSRPERPSFEEKKHFGPGERGTLALIFSNAEPRDGKVRILCDVTVFDPEGSRTLVKKGPCYDGPYAGPNILHPTGLDLSFAIGPNDPTGQAGFKVRLTDVHSRRSVDLEVSFRQGAAP